MSKDIAALPETIALNSLKAFINNPPASNTHSKSTSSTIPKAESRQLLQSILTTFNLHIQSRISSLCGEGYYTIGPCGEENLAAIALAFKGDRDSVALHYRHLGVSILRNYQDRLAGESSNLETLKSVIFDRARGYTVSSLDPVSGGNHCTLGGCELDYVVTSTLASQCSPAVGRAMGTSIAHHLAKKSNTKSSLPFKKDSVHFVSLGDGSTTNGHFLSAINLARYAKHRTFKCPVVFGISDNQICISLRNYGFLTEYLKSTGLHLFTCTDGTDVNQVYRATKEATDYSRKTQKPSVVIYSNLTRRFGHAATDRQNAYLSTEEINDAKNEDNVERAIMDLVGGGGVTWEEVKTDMEEIEKFCIDGFDSAAMEKKIR